jgi:hypothetical protein
MLSGPGATMSTDMTADQLDRARMERALDRLAEHCELTARRQSRIDERRAAVRACLEHELGTELAHTLLRGLAFAPAA